MKILKRTMALVLVLATVFLLASCGTVSLEKDFKGKEKITWATEIGNYTGNTSAGENLVVLTDSSAGGSVYTVYNYETGTVIKSVVNTAASRSVTVPSIASVEGSDFVLSMTTNKDTGKVEEVELWDEKGVLFASANSVDDYRVILDEIVILNGKAYTLDKSGSFKEAFAADSLNLIRAATAKSDKYFYMEDETGVTVLSKTGKRVSYYRFRDCYERENCFILANGNIAATYADVLPFDAEEFDVYESGVKFNYIVEIVNAKTGRVKTVERDHMIAELLPEEEKEPYDTGKNVGMVTIIENERVSRTTLAILDNTLDIVADLDSLVPGAVDVELISQGHYIVTDQNGNEHLLNAKKKLLQTAAGGFDGRNETYLVYGNKVYTHDLTEVFDLSADDYGIVAYGSDYIILSRVLDDGYYEYAKLYGGEKTVINAGGNGVTTSYQFLNADTDLYCIRDSSSETPYQYYNAGGAKVMGALTEQLRVVAVHENGNVVVAVGGVFSLLQPTRAAE